MDPAKQNTAAVSKQGLHQHSSHHHICCNHHKQTVTMHMTQSSASDRWAMKYAKPAAKYGSRHAAVKQLASPKAQV